MPGVTQETYLQTVGVECLAAPDMREALSREVRRGLIARPRSLSPWMFYDTEGSGLFERITGLPEYYPTRTERAILAEYADEIIARTYGNGRLPLRLVELGAGTASKTCILLKLPCAFRATWYMCRSMSAPTRWSWHARTLPEHCRRFACNPSFGIM